MQRTIRYLSAAAVAGFCAAATPAMAAGDDDQVMIKIGTSDTRDITYRVANAICSAVNKARQGGANILCLAQVGESGSITNIRQVLDGDIGFAIVQSDVVGKAVRGEIGFPTRHKPDELRQVFTLFPLPFHLVVRPDVGAKTFDDLRGHPFNTGPIGSGTQSALTDYVLAKGWNFSEFPLIQMFGRDDSAKALCDGTVDGFFLATGIGSNAIVDAIKECDARILPFDDAVAQKLVLDLPYYFKMEITGGVYENHPQPIPTIGALAMVVTRMDVPDYVVGELTQEVLNDLDNLKSVHRSLVDMTGRDMANDDAVLPYHAAAAAVFQKAGLR